MKPLSNFDQISLLKLFLKTSAANLATTSGALLCDVIKDY